MAASYPRKFLQDYLFFAKQVIEVIVAPTFSRSKRRFALTRLHLEIYWIFLRERRVNKATYNSHREVYQTFEAIELLATGRLDPTGTKAETCESRVAQYDILKVLTPQSRVLDIGANTGFISIIVGQHAREVVALEPNAYLIEIGKKSARYLGVTSVTFVDEYFEKYTDHPQSFDLILSLAALHTGDGRERGDVSQYLSQVRTLLAPNGHFFFESVSLPISGEGERHDLAAIDRFMNLMRTEMTVLSEKKLYYKNPGGVDYHRWLVLARPK